MEMTRPVAHNTTLIHSGSQSKQPAIVTPLLVVVVVHVPLEERSAFDVLTL
jgi:hypothetical protein